ncbi:hypothetical protein EIP91_011880 [Steccherinum ochraceum]|uniref:Uncharacterized protein n=1 Tax=Steccherinum ochraceum TaxID=92696 RepID=A0A4R0RVE9_9APHY|nr:hypothetical protein EIP91_011880 [Steccherinum ochraceum]
MSQSYHQGWQPLFDPESASARVESSLGRLAESLRLQEERSRSLQDDLGDPSAYPVNAIHVEAPPPTQYATRYHRDGRAEVTSVDWWRVINLEPTQVAQWVQFLHTTGCPEVYELLKCLSNFLNRDHKLESGGEPTQWYAYVETQLPCILVDMVSEPDMFQDDPTAFKSVSYGAEILAAIVYCLFMIMSGGIEGRSRRDLKCMKGLSSRIGRFSRAMWSQRHILQSSLRRDSTGCDDGEIPFYAFTAMTLIDRIYTEFHMRHEPLSMHVAHFFLHHWVYSPETGDCRTAIRLTFEILQFPRHIMQKMSRLFRDDRASSDEERHVMYVCTALLTNAPKSFSKVMLPEGSGIIPSLLIYCQRQLCSSTVSNSVKAIYMTSQILFIMLAAKETRAYFERQINRYAGQLNLIGLIKCFFVQEVQEGHQNLTQTRTC